jgi:hypothetical protein
VYEYTDAGTLKTFACGGGTGPYISVKTGTSRRPTPSSTSARPPTAPSGTSNFFELGGKLYCVGDWQVAVGNAFAPPSLPGSNTWQYVLTGGPSSSSAAQIFPSTGRGWSPTPGCVRPTVFGTSLVYIGQDYAAGGNHGVPGQPVGLYKMAQVSSSGGADWSSCAKVDLGDDLRPAGTRPGTSR